MSGVVVRDVGAVRVVALDRAERRNSLDMDTRRALLAALGAAHADEAVRALVLTGEGAVFCAGGDIASMSPDPDAARERLSLVNDLARALAVGPTPVVAAVEGGAHGLGLSLACACDVVVAGTSAVFAASFARIGLTADTGLVHTLPRRVGPGRARAMLLTAQPLDAPAALAAGLVDSVVDDGTALAAATSLAEGVAALSRHAVAATRGLLDTDHGDLDGALLAERDAQVTLLATDAFAEGRSAFLERRTPDFRGHGG